MFEFALSQPKPNVNRRFSIGDRILTTKNQKRKIISVVGPYTYKLDNGFCINARKIRRKLHPGEVDDDLHQVLILPRLRPPDSETQASTVQTVPPTGDSVTMPPRTFPTVPTAPETSSRAGRVNQH